MADPDFAIADLGPFKLVLENIIAQITAFPLSNCLFHKKKT
jgi:hypothetical protein